MLIKSKLLYLFFFVEILTANAQKFSLSYNYYLTPKVDRAFTDTSFSIHSSIKPFNSDVFTDSILSSNNFFGFKKVLDMSVLKINKSNFFIEINPILNFNIGAEDRSGRYKFKRETSGGISLKSFFFKKLSFELDYLVDYSIYPARIDSLQEKYQYSTGYVPLSKKNYLNYLQTNLNYRINKYFFLQTGFGRFFIGEGYRSLFLSDYAYNYPYLKFDINFWRFHFFSMYSQTADIFSGNKYPQNTNYRTKGNVTHYLSFNASKWLNIGFFETVIFESSNNTFRRKFDLNYLNPLIFIRPIEFSLGSADNVLIGLSTKIKLFSNIHVYSQFLIDELIVSRFLKNDGWWGNKQGFQLGLKYFDALSVKNLYFQAEYNIVRPYTYSHFYNDTNVFNLSGQSYSHRNTPLAHPLGANFYDFFLRTNYVYKNFIFDIKFTYSKVGLDSNDVSYGQNVNLSYTLRPKKANYLHRVAQGLVTDQVLISPTVSYMLFPKNNIMLQLGYSFKSTSNLKWNNQSHYMFLGIKTALFNRYLAN